jgi:hypothetical protein
VDGEHGRWVLIGDSEHCGVLISLENYETGGPAEAYVVRRHLRFRNGRTYASSECLCWLTLRKTGDTDRPDVVLERFISASLALAGSEAGRQEIPTFHQRYY